MRLQARAFLWITTTFAACLLAMWVARLMRGEDAADPLLVVLLGGMAMVATHFPLQLTPRYKIDLSITAYFAAILLFAPPIAIVLIAASRLGAELLLCLRRNPVSGKRRRSPRAAVFNAAQLTIAGSVAEVVLYAGLPQRAPVALDRLEAIVAVAAAAVAMYVLNGGLVATMVALQLGQRPVDVWLAGRPLDAVHFGGMFLLGVLAAMVAMHYPLGVVLIALPAVIVHLSVRNSLELLEQTTSAVEAMADVVDQRDRYTYGHSHRVSEQAVRVARRMGLDRDQVEMIRLAARVHDLGKLGVPDHVLLKDGPLTDEEWELMRRHVTLGCDILSRFPEYRAGLELVRLHHERVDGRGYPLGVGGERLPLGAQIIAVSDALDAMTSDRPYRRGLSVEKALAELRRGKGTQWRPDVVEAMEKVMVLDLSEELRVGAAQRVAATA